MTYNRIKGIRVTDMCIYIDAAIENSHIDDELIYEYLYHISMSIAKKHKYFETSEDYDTFALFCASKLYLRLRDIDKPQVKSILNYVNKTIGCMKLDFEKEGLYKTNCERPNDHELMYTCENIIGRALTHTKFNDWEFTMQNVSKTARKFLSSIPYDIHSVEWLHIYLSVMLTFINSITPNKSVQELLDDLESANKLDADKLYAIMQEESRKLPIMFRLDPNMSDYILVLYRQLRSIIARDLSEILHTKVYSDYMSAKYEVSTFMKDELTKNEY